MKTNEELLRELIHRLDSISYIRSDDIPDIELYMDQVTTFMENQLGHAKRNPEDKILTKTMINNYAKNNLLPAPVKKKYNREHMLLLIFIYYYKNLLSFHDIETLFAPLTETHFSTSDSRPLKEIYEELFSMEADQLTNLKKDVLKKFQTAEKKFKDSEDKDGEYLTLFAFVSELAFDVYLKKQIIEYVIDQLEPEKPVKKKEKMSNKKGQGV